MNIQPIFNDRTKDLLFAILAVLGGKMEDVKPLYFDTRDDLLYAILEKLVGGNLNTGIVDSFKVVESTENRQTRNYPAIKAADKVLVSIGGLFIDPFVTDDTRYFLVDKESGDIDLPEVRAGEMVIIFKF